ncbi:hypothetical protein RKE29_05980 [Streptomyces sp. B1866]|uniref:hypothetical protein n=1 Tax=Streptomyces sp. B1866 TaxID=3075431 RepID=UPI00288E13B0|nr:hypothetical protein [Streptomyces sp. B1866]MDT3396189.1 hypothetical protein [Streptomyces sp. B1866]
MSAMTIRVYEVDSRTGRRVHERGQLVIRADWRTWLYDSPSDSLRFPPCVCRRCRAKERPGTPP